jgi:hypothetical protein
MHRHRHDYVFVTLGDAHVSNQVEGKPSVDLKLPDGETRFVAGTLPTSQSISRTSPIRDATMELTQDEMESCGRRHPMGRRKMAKRPSPVAGS